MLACSSWTGQAQLTCCSAWAGVTMEPIHRGSPHQSLVPFQPRWSWDRWIASWLESPLPMTWGQASPCGTTRARSAPAHLCWWCCLLNLATYSVPLFFMGFYFSSSPTGEISPINIHVQEQRYLESFGPARSLRSFYRERARDSVC